MNEAIFEVVLFNNSHVITPLNPEAVELREKFKQKFPELDILMLILLSPNTMEEYTNEKLVYSLPLEEVSDVFIEIENKLV